MGNIDFHHLQCCCLGITHIFGDLVVTSPPQELVETPRTYVRSLYLFLRRTCAQCMSSPGGLWAGTLWAKQMMWKAVEGDGLILDHAGRLKFWSRLVVTGAIVIGRDDGISGFPSRSLFKWVPRLLGERQRGEPTIGDALNEFGWSGVLERSHCRLVNDENREGAQGPDIPVVVNHRSSDLSSVSCSLELLREVHNYGECCVFV